MVNDVMICIRTWYVRSKFDRQCMLHVTCRNNALLHAVLHEEIVVKFVEFGVSLVHCEHRAAWVWHVEYWCMFRPHWFSVRDIS